MSFFEAVTGAIGKIGGGVVGAVGGITVEIVGNVIAGVQELAGDSVGATRTRQETDNAAESFFEIATDLGEGVGQLTGGLVDGVIEVAASAGEVVGTVGGGIASLGVTIVGETVAGIQSVTGFDEAAEQTRQLSENVAAGVVEVGGQIGRIAGKAVLIKPLIAQAVGAVVVAPFLDVELPSEIADLGDVSEGSDLSVSHLQANVDMNTYTVATPAVDAFAHPPHGHTIHPELRFEGKPSVHFVQSHLASADVNVPEGAVPTTVEAPADSTELTASGAIPKEGNHGINGENSSKADEELTYKKFRAHLEPKFSGQNRA